MTSDETTTGAEDSGAKTDEQTGPSVPTVLDPRLEMTNYEMLRGGMGAAAMPRRGLGADVSSQLASIRASESRRLDRVRAESRRLVESSRGPEKDTEPAASDVLERATASQAPRQAESPEPETDLDSELEALRSGGSTTASPPPGPDRVEETVEPAPDERSSTEQSRSEARMPEAEVWEALGATAAEEAEPGPPDGQETEREDEETDMGQGTKRLAAMEQAWGLLDSFEKELFAESAGLLSSARAKQEKDRVRALAMESAASHEARADRLGELAEEYRAKNQQLRLELGTAIRRIEELQAMLVDSETGSGGEGGAVAELTGPEVGEPEQAAHRGAEEEAEPEPAEASAPFGSLPKDFQGESTDDSDPEPEPEEPVRDFASEDDLPDDFDSDEGVEEIEPDFDEIPDGIGDDVPDDVPDDPMDQIPDDSGLG